jgi:uncharacterized phage protein gp47/JayE
MSLQTPQISELRETNIAHIESELDQEDQSLPKSTIRVIATVLAGLFVLLMKYAGWMFLQQFVRWASFRETTVLGRVLVPLRMLGDENGVDPPSEGAVARFTVNVVPITLGSTLKANTAIVDRPTQRIYKTLADTVLSTNPTLVTVTAAKSGAIYNVTTSTALHFTSPQSNAQRELAVEAIVIEGQDAEGEDQYRARIDEKKKAPPQGGAHSDYRLWAKEISGITNVYPYNNGPGKVIVYVEATPASSGSPDGFPTLAQRNAVLARINLPVTGVASRRTINANTSVASITRKALGVEVLGLVVDGPEGLAAVKARIEAGCDEYFRACEPYILGLSLPPRRDIITQSALAGVVGDIVAAAEGRVTEVRLLDGATQIRTYSLGRGVRAKSAGVFWL